jgi:hypothetical protein
MHDRLVVHVINKRKLCGSPSRDKVAQQAPIPSFVCGGAMQMGSMWECTHPPLFTLSPHARAMGLGNV